LSKKDAILWGQTQEQFAIEYYKGISEAVVEPTGMTHLLHMYMYVQCCKQCCIGGKKIVKKNGNVNGANMAKACQRKVLKSDFTFILQWTNLILHGA
jgi:hypothetical protein